MKRLISILLASFIFASNPAFAAMSVSNGGVSPYSSTDTLSAYAAGTVYTVTNAQALAHFGTTDPSVTLTKPGTYLIFARANFQNVAATYAANRTITTKLRRTNNTPADLTNATTAFGTGVLTAISGSAGDVDIPFVLYSTTVATDIVQIFCGMDIIPSAGSVTCSEASIVAIRLY